MTTKGDEMANKTRNGNGSLVAIVAVTGLLGIVAGVYAMVQPMNQRIDHLTQYVERSENRVTRTVFEHTSLHSHPDAAREMAQISERFKEVETQFRGLRELMTVRIAEMERRIERQEIDGNPRHDERIQTLERILLDLANEVKNGKEQ